jgi:hypothetical protein
MDIILAHGLPNQLSLWTFLIIRGLGCPNQLSLWTFLIIMVLGCSRAFCRNDADNYLDTGITMLGFIGDDVRH